MSLIEIFGPSALLLFQIGDGLYTDRAAGKKRQRVPVCISSAAAKSHRSKKEAPECPFSMKSRRFEQSCS